MNDRVNPHQRFVPCTSPNGSPGVLDRFNASPRVLPPGVPRVPRQFVRDYTAPEVLDLCAWLNDREAGYAPRLGAIK